MAVAQAYQITILRVKLITATEGIKTQNQSPQSKATKTVGALIVLRMERKGK